MNDSHVPINITKTLRRKLTAIDDQKCLIVEFCNEEQQNALSVGYENWLQNSDIDIQKAIEEKKQVPTYWPIDIAIAPAKLLARALVKGKFSKEIVVLKDSGDWVSLKGKLKSLQKTGSLVVSRNSRKKIMKKVQKSPPRSATQKKKSKSTNTGATVQQEKEVSLNIAKAHKNKKRFSWDDLGNENESQESDSGLYSDGTNNSVENRSTQSKGNGNSKAIIVDEMPLGVRIDNQQQSGQNDSDVEKESDLEAPQEVSSDSEKEQEHPRTGNGRRANKRSHDDIDDVLDGYSSFEENLQPQPRQPLNTATPIRNNANEPELPEGVIRRLPIPIEIKKNLPKKSINAFVSAMIDNFFTTEYLATHSPTGKIPNSLKATGVVAKPALHPETV